jgi:hypothetical protein
MGISSNPSSNNICLSDTWGILRGYVCQRQPLAEPPLLRPHLPLDEIARGPADDALDHNAPEKEIAKDTS